MAPPAPKPAAPPPPPPPPAAAAPVAPPPPVAAPIAPPAPPAAAAPRPAAPAAPKPGGSATGARPINPFLANDPNAKAKRLARALISDLISYFPKKKDEGIANGTLRELFKEEIKKSYEEFTGQIGKEFAETTTHFTDALNDILANGQKVFSGNKSGVE
jgi:hypothetical protein